MRTRPLAMLVLLALVIAPILPSARPALASTITVTTTADELTTNGQCSLREAIRNANADATPHPDCMSGSGADLIQLPAGLYELATTGPLVGANEDGAATGDLDVTGDLVINGAGVGATQISGGGLNTAPGGGIIGDRVFDVGPVSGTHLKLLHLTVLSGWTPEFGDGGGVRNAATLTLNDVRLWQNHGSNGGGLHNAGTGTATLIDVTFDDNQADFGFDGGAINNRGTLTVTRATFNHNQASQANGAGGAISSSGNATLTNVTFFNNYTRYGSRGHAVQSTGGTVALVNATVANNDQFGSFGAAALFVESGSITIRNTIVAGSTPTSPNCSPGVVSLGGNLDSGTTCGLAGPNDKSSTDPLLGPLAENGGPTQTMLLLAGSPAIDAALAAGCPETDQRSQPRPRDGDDNGTAACDMGAVEILAASQVVVCDPRPPVKLGHLYDSGGLRFVVEVTSNPTGKVNSLKSIQFLPTQHATIRTITDPFYSFPGGQTVTYPADTRATSFWVQHDHSSAIATAPIVVTDDCGSWQTFVGGGPSAFAAPPPGSQAPGVTPTPGPPTAPPTLTASCSTRPPVAVQTAPDGTNRLRVTIRSGRGSISEIRIGRSANAAVDVAGRTGVGPDTAVTIPGSPGDVTLYVRRLAPGAVTVPFTVVDGCGAWPTVVGGGPTAF